MALVCGGILFLAGLAIWACLTSARDNKTKPGTPHPPSDREQLIWEAAERTVYLTDCQAEIFNVPPGCVIVPIVPTPEGHNLAVVDSDNRMWYSFCASEV